MRQLTIKDIDVEKIEEEQKKFFALFKWLGENYDKIRKEYAGRFIAIKGNRIIADDEIFERLTHKLEERNEIGDVYLEYVRREEEVFL
jgi:hypothetical protein